MQLTKLALAAGIACAMAANPATAQENSGSSSSRPAAPSPKPAELSAVRPDQTVITVRQLCKHSNAKPADCSRTVTRQEFEELMQALHPGQQLSAGARSNLAKVYAEYISVEAAARNAGMEETSEFHEFMDWMRVLSATEYYRRKLQAEYSKPSSEDVQAYYQQHIDEYEKARLTRVLVPRDGGAGTDRDAFDKKAHEAADAARTSLASGSDPAEVQKTAYAALNLNNPPATDLGLRRRKDLLPDEAATVFGLKAGAVTPVQVEPRSYVVYKVVDRETLSEDEKKQIAARITEEKFRDTMKSILDGTPVELNQEYFGAATAADSEPPRNPHAISNH